MKASSLAAALVLVPAVVRAAAAIQTTVTVPFKVVTGQPFTVMAAVGNTGSATVANLVPADLPSSLCPLPDFLAVAPALGGSASLVSSGATAGCPAALAPGQSAAFTWAHAAMAPGFLTFTVTAAGVEVGGSATPLDAGTATVEIIRPALLSATLSLEPAGTAAYGATVTAYLDVTNLGDAKAVFVRRHSVTVTGTAAFSPLPCPPLAPLCPDDPARAEKDELGPGASGRWTWLVRVAQAGSLTVSVMVAGTDDTAGWQTVSNVSSTTLDVPAPSVLAAVVTRPGDLAAGTQVLAQGQELLVHLAVTNLGATEVCQASFAVRLGGEARWISSAAVEVSELGDSLLPICFLPLETRRFALRLRLAADAPVGASWLEVVPVGAERWTGDPTLPSAPPLAVEVVSGGRSAFCGVVPNPVRAADAAAAICYSVAPADDGARVTLRIYSLAGELVRTLQDEPRPAGAHAVAWDRRNAEGRTVGSGVYLVNLTVGRARDTRKVAVLR